MPRRAKHKPAEKMLALNLTRGERAILTELFTLDKELEERLNHDKNGAPLSLTQAEWELAAEGIAAEVNHTASRNRRRLLEGLLPKIEDLLPKYCPEQPDCDGEKVIDLTVCGPPGPHVEAEALEYLHRFVDDLLQTCSTTGLDVQKLLESFIPIRVEPQNRIGVRLNRKQRALLMDLAETTAAVKAAIRNTPARQQKVELTLREVNELENAVARLIHDTSDNILKRALQRVDGELMNIQVHYTDGNDDPPSAIKLAMCPESLSRGALVRQMLNQLLQARLPAKKGRGQR
jgi:hypothetical protein